jgi:hypothetical protein
LREAAMRILSIDIGIKNLAFCLINDATVEKWDIIDLSASDADENPPLHKCCCQTKAKTDCTRKALFYKDGKAYCKTHANSHEFLFICPENLTEKHLKKLKLQELNNLCIVYKLQVKLEDKKADVLKLLQDHREKTCFLSIPQAPKVDASKIDLVTIGQAIKTKFDQVFAEAGQIDVLLIENQISPIANRMKTIQGMVAQYFILKETCTKIEFVNAGNKLNQFLKADPVAKAQVKEEEEENVIVDAAAAATYKGRKQMGIEKCEEELNKTEANRPLIRYLQAHKKKDDLADCYLQAVWYINKKK